MADRLNQLMKCYDVCYATGSPLLLEACALYQDITDGQCIAQIKWKNLDTRTVKAALIVLDGYDIFQQKLEPVVFQYDQLTAAQGDSFGIKTPIQIRHAKMVSYDVKLRAVAFEDGSVWHAQTDTAYTALPEFKQHHMAGDLFAQYDRDLSALGFAAASANQPQYAMGLWQCGCGSWQLSGCSCLECGVSLDTLCDAANSDRLQQHLQEYLEEQERLRIAEEERLAREAEEQRRKEKEAIRRRERARIAAEQQALRAKKKRRRNRLIAAACVLLAAGAGCAAKYYFIPQSKYDQALALMQSGQFEEASAMFTALEDYSDAQHRARQTVANYYFSVGAYDSVGDVYATLPQAYQDHAADFVIMYDSACAKMENGQFDEAIDAFTKLGNYSDSKSMISEVNYRKAAHLAETGDRTGAAALYQSLNGYRDCDKKILQLQADTLFDKGSFSEAWNVYASLPEEYQTHNADYESMYAYALTLMESDDYSQAATAFGLVDGYRDAADQAKESIYRHASQLSSQGDYAGALSVYAQLNGYSDSSNLSIQAVADKYFAEGRYEEAYKYYSQLDAVYHTHAADYAAMYENALALQSSGSYDEAVAAFSVLGGYSDSTDQILQSRYLKAASLADQANYDAAIALYQELADYSDSRSLASKASADKLFDSGFYAVAYQVYASLGEAYQTHAEDYAAMYDAAVALQAAGSYDEAEAAFDLLGAYSDSSTQISQTKYLKAASLAASGRYDEAIALYEQLGAYLDSAQLAVKASADQLYAAGELSAAYEVYIGLDEAYHTHSADYAAAYDAAEAARAAGNYDLAYDQFMTLGSYRDSVAKALQCGKDKADGLYAAGRYGEASTVYAFIGDEEKSLLSAYEHAAQLASEGQYLQAAQQYALISDYKDSREQHYQMGLTAKQNNLLADAYEILVSDIDYSDAKEAVYQIGVSASAAQLYEVSVPAFTVVGAYKDSSMNLTMDTYAYGEQLHAAGRYDEAAAVFTGMNGFSNTSEKAQISAYAAAEEAMEKGDYQNAMDRFAALGSYSDSADQVKEAKFRWADSCFDAGDYEQAKTMFASLEDYSSSRTRLKAVKYAIAKSMYDAGDYESAISGFHEIKDYSNAATQELASRYALYTTYYDAGKYDEAIAGFELIAQSHYSDSATQAKKSHYAKAQALDAGDRRAAYDEYVQAEDYSDARHQVKTHAYEIALACQEATDYVQAIDWYEIAADYSDAKDQLYKIGSFYFSTQDYELSINAFKTLAGYRDASEYLKRIGHYYQMESDNTKAYLAYGYADPTGVESEETAALKTALLNQASSYLTSGKPDEARDVYITLAKIDPAQKANINMIHFLSFMKKCGSVKIGSTAWKYLTYENGRFVFVSESTLTSLPYETSYYSSNKTTVDSWIRSAKSDYFNFAETQHVSLWIMSQSEVSRYMPDESDRKCGGSGSSSIWTSTANSSSWSASHFTYEGGSGSMGSYDYEYDDTSRGVRPGMKLSYNRAVYDLFIGDPSRYVFKNRSGNVMTFEPLVEENGQRLSYSYELPKPKTEYTVSSIGSYGFKQNSKGFYESQNKNRSTSYAMCEITFTTDTGYIYLDCINYAERGYDYGLISKLDTSLSSSISSDSSSKVFKSFSNANNSSVQTIAIPVNDSEEHTICVKFIKDGSGNDYNDSLQFSVRFE